MSKKYDYDLAVIGSGSAGLVAAVGATKLGLSVVLLEGRYVGGDCLNFGCVPSKSLLHAGRVAKTIRGGSRYGVNAGEPEIDYEAVKKHVSGAQDTIREHETAEHFRKMGMDVIEEYGSFVDAHTLKAGDRKITAKLIVIATGSRPRIVPIDGLEEAGFITNEEIFTLEKKPEHLAVIGAGPIGIEMAWAHRQLGSQVTVLERQDRILPKDDKDMSDVVLDSMAEDGVDFQFHADIKRVEKTESGKRIVYAKDGEETHIDVDQILISAGRLPNIEKLNLEAAGVDYTKRGVTVNASQQTSVKNIYAVGDVAGGLLFTHSASLEAGTFIQKGIFHLPAKTSYKAFPWVTYTDPELASVGLNETMAKKQGVEYHLATSEFSGNDRAIAEGETRGRIKVLIEPSRMLGLKGGRILGAQIVGPHAGELIHEYVVAMKSGLKASAVNGTVHAYPTLSEINKRAISTFMGEKLFQPRTRRWLGRIFGYAGIQHPGEEKSKSGKKGVSHA